MRKGFAPFAYALFLLVFYSFSLEASRIPERLKCVVKPQYASMWTENKKGWEGLGLKEPVNFALDDIDAKQGKAMFLNSKANLPLTIKSGNGYSHFSGHTTRGSPFEVMLLWELSGRGYPVYYLVHSPAAEYSLALSVYSGYCREN